MDDRMDINEQNINAAEPTDAATFGAPEVPVSYPDMTDEEIDAALQVGFDDIAAGRCIPLEKAHADFRRRHAKWSNTPSR